MHRSNLLGLILHGTFNFFDFAVGIMEFALDFFVIFVSLAEMSFKDDSLSWTFPFKVATSWRILSWPSLNFTSDSLTNASKSSLSV